MTEQEKIYSQIKKAQYLNFEEDEQLTEEQDNWHILQQKEFINQGMGVI